MKIYSLNKNIVKTNQKADKEYIHSFIVSYHSSLELVNRAIKKALYSHIIREGLISKKYDKVILDRAKNNEIWLKSKNSELNYDKYPIFYFKEIDVEVENIE